MTTLTLNAMATSFVPSQSTIHATRPDSCVSNTHALHYDLQCLNGRANNLSTSFTRLQAKFFALTSDLPADHNIVSKHLEDECRGAFLVDMSGSSWNGVPQNRRTRRGMARSRALFQTLFSSQVDVMHALEQGEYDLAQTKLESGTQSANTLAGLISQWSMVVAWFQKAAEVATVSKGEGTVDCVLNDEHEGEDEEENEDSVIFILEKPTFGAKMQGKMEKKTDGNETKGSPVDEGTGSSLCRPEARGERNRRWTSFEILGSAPSMARRLSDSVV